MATGSVSKSVCEILDGYTLGNWGFGLEVMEFSFKQQLATTSLAVHQHIKAAHSSRGVM